MSQVQSRLALLEQEIGFVAALQLAGADIWRPEDIKERMAKAYAEQPVGILYRLFKEGSGRACTFFAVCLGWASYTAICALQIRFGQMPDALADMVGIFAFCWSWYHLYKHHGRGPHDWRTNQIYKASTGSYMSNWRTSYVPCEALQLMRRIAALRPQACFEVSFLGNDPVLWSYEPGKRNERIAIRMWDEVNGVEIVIPSPR